MSSPPIMTLPVVGLRNPETMRRIVVLPQPDGPRIEKNSPALILRSLGSTAVKSPNLMETETSATSLPRAVCKSIASSPAQDGNAIRTGRRGGHPVRFVKSP